MSNVNRVIAFGGMFVILVLLVAGVVVAAESQAPRTASTSTQTLTKGNFFGTFISVTELSRTNSTLSPGSSTFTFVVSSGTVGTFNFGVATQGAALPLETSTKSLELPLPSLVSVSFRSPSVLSGMHNATVTFTITTVNTPRPETVQLEFVVLQNQGQGLTAESTYPINFGVA